MSLTTVVCTECGRRIGVKYDGSLQRHRRKSKGGWAPWCVTERPPVEVKRSAADHARDLARARGDQGQTVTSC